MEVSCQPRAPGGTWIQTYSGLKFDYVREYWQHDDVKLVDIATALSRAPRYCGHTLLPSYVAQHSVHVSEHVEANGGTPFEQLVGLLHDATEAYLADIPSPAKALLPEYSELELSLWKRISHKYFGEVVWPLPKIVKDADVALLIAEAMDSFGFLPLDNWTQHYAERSPIQIIPWTGEYARSRFLQRFVLLSREAECVD